MGEMTRRGFLKAAGAGAASLALLGAMRQAQAATGKRPNILLLFSDDQRFSTINALGCKEVITPNLDTLVKSGVSFTRASIMGGTHGAVCVASRAMLMSGRSIYHLQNKGNAIPPEHVTLPELLKRNGYRTFHTGKWHQDKASYARSFDSGAKIFFGGMSNQAAVPVNDFDPSGAYPKEKQYTGEKFSSELFSDAAIDFLKGYKEEKPFFAYVAYTAPHDPRMAPEPYKAMYDPAKIALPPNFLPEHPFDNGALKIRDELLAPFPRTPAVVREHIAAYYAMITHLDAQIGRVLAALKESGQAENTIVIFAGDNGLALGQHGLFGKQSVYEHSVRVPLIIAGPGIPKDVKSDAFCYLLDLYPTLCEMTGVARPATADGLSLGPVLRGEGKAVREELFFSFMDTQRAVKTEECKLIEYNVNGQRHTQLFDMTRDPWETKNLAEDPAQAETLKRMRAKLEGWRKELGDPTLDPNYKAQAGGGAQKQKKGKGKGKGKNGKKKAGAA